MARPLLALVAALALPVLGLAVPAQTQAAGGLGACLDLSTGVVVAPGNADRITVDAPVDQLITGYCVASAGLKGTSGLPEYVTLAVAVAVPTISLTHTAGGNLTHYSLTLQPILEPSPDATPAPSPTPVMPAPADPSYPDNPPSSTTGSFDWNWTYADPACDALTVAYPSDIPSGQSNDVNIRFSSNRGPFTLNFHNNETTWVGTTGFGYATHRGWPTDLTSYDVTWVQVGGTNYHWQGDVPCLLAADADPSTLDVPLAVTEVEGFRAGTVTVARGKAAPADVVEVAQLGSEALVLQKLSGSTWTNVATLATTADGAARVVYPRRQKRGAASYRLSVPSSESITGATTAAVRIKTR